MTSKPELTYDTAFAELESIAAELQAGDLPLEDLTNKVKRAYLLISVCKEKLRDADKDMTALMAILNDE